MRMLVQPRARPTAELGYLMAEALVYIGVVFLLLGVGYAALYHCIDSSIVLRRNAGDVISALHAGERWRADIRAANQTVRVQTTKDSQILQLRGMRTEVEYRYADGVVDRRANSGSWVHLIRAVKSSAMQSEPRPNVTAWRWDLELQPQTKGSIKAGRIRPLFTFLAVPETAPAP